MTARLPPQNLDAERSVLGGVLIDNAGLDEVAELLKPSDFYRETHRKVYDAMLAISGRSEPIDRVTVKAELTRVGVFESVGDDFVDLLDKFTPDFSNLTKYAEIIRDRSVARSILEAAATTVRECYEQEGTSAELADRVESRFFALRSEGPKGGLIPIGKYIKSAYQSLEKQYSNNKDIVGTSTGIADLDEAICGYGVGLHIIAGRPSMGKTAMALDGLRAAARTGTAAFFSAEMTSEEVTLRALSAEARVPHMRLRKPTTLTDNDWAAIARHGPAIEAMPLYLDDAARTASEIRAGARRIASKCAGTDKPLKLIVVDHLGRLDHGQQKGERLDIAMGRTVVALKWLAKQLQVPVVLLSQLNRSVDHRPDHRPQQSDLRECGDIEQEADTILFPYRAEFYRDDSVPPGQADIIIGKQRNGPPGEVRVAWLAQYMTFTDMRVDPAGRQLGLEPPPHSDEDRR